MRMLITEISLIYLILTPKLVMILASSRLLLLGNSSKCSIAKIQSSGYKAHHFRGIAPQERENDNEYHKKWADKIINFMNNEIKWKYSNNFKFRGDLTKMINGKVAKCLDEVLLDEDIGGFVGIFFFDSVDDIKDNSDVMKDIFGNVENVEVGDSILMANWKNWSNEED